MAVELAPITDADVPAVAQFLHENLNTRVPVAAWTRAMRMRWADDAPNHGYFLAADDQVVGANLAFYSDRTIDGRTERFCNLGAWCVLDEHRAQGVKLPLALLRQRGYHFTDLSPSGNVVALNRKLKFVDLDTTTAIVPATPWPTARGSVRVSADAEELAASLTGADRQIYDDHRAAAAANHLLITAGRESCYVMFRKDTRKRVRAFATVLHVGNPDLFRRAVRPLGNHLLLHHAAVATLVETRLAGGQPTGATLVSNPRPKMFRSDSLDADNIDYLYSELTCLPW